MQAKNVGDNQPGIYMIVRPYKVSPCSIDRETFNDVIVKIGRSKNLSKRLSDYYDFGFSENEIVCLPVPENDLCIYEKWIKNIVKGMKTTSKWRGNEWFFLDGYRHEACIDYTEQLRYDRSLLRSLWSAIQSSSHVHSDDLIEFAIAFNLRLPGLRLGKSNVLSYLWMHHDRVKYDTIEQHFKDCITHSSMFGNRHLRELLWQMERAGLVTSALDDNEYECFAWNSWTELTDVESTNRVFI